MIGCVAEVIAGPFWPLVVLAHIVIAAALAMLRWRSRRHHDCDCS